MTLATTMSRKARTSTIAGQKSSHFVYCSVSGFWQHLEGQHPGQQQQQHRNGQISHRITRPRTNGPANSPRSVYRLGPWVTTPARIPLGSFIIAPISVFLWLIKYLPFSFETSFHGSLRTGGISLSFSIHECVPCGVVCAHFSHSCGPCRDLQ